MSALHDYSVLQNEAAKALAAFQIDLKFVRRHAGNPSYETLDRRSGGGLPRSTLNRALNGDKVPSWRVIELFLQVCGVSGDDINSWRDRWAEVMNLFDPLPTPTSGDNNTHNEPARECPDCGALIANTARHAEWHDNFVPKQTDTSTPNRRKENVRRLFG